MARPPTSAHRTRRASRSATALRSSCSTGVATVLSRWQTQPRVRRGRGQPGPHEAVDLPAVSVRVLASHPLSVEFHPKVVHVQCRAQPLGLGSPVKGTRPSGRAQPSEPRNPHPEPAHPVHASIVVASPVVSAAETGRTKRRLADPSGRHTAPATGGLRQVTRRRSITFRDGCPGRTARRARARLCMRQTPQLWPWPVWTITADLFEIGKLRGC